MAFCNERGKICFLWYVGINSFFFSTNVTKTWSFLNLAWIRDQNTTTIGLIWEYVQNKCYGQIRLSLEVSP